MQRARLPVDLTGRRESRSGKCGRWFRLRGRTSGEAYAEGFVHALGLNDAVFGGLVRVVVEREVGHVDLVRDDGQSIDGAFAQATEFAHNVGETAAQGAVHFDLVDIDKRGHEGWVVSHVVGAALVEAEALGADPGELATLLRREAEQERKFGFDRGDGIQNGRAVIVGDDSRDAITIRHV